MNKLKSRHRYQLVYPFQGTKIYKTSTFNNGIKKCYDELKMSGKFTNNLEKFTVVDLDTLDAYNFKLKKKIPTKNINDHSHKSLNHIIGGKLDNTNVDLSNRVDKIEEHVQEINNKLTNVVSVLEDLKHTHNSNPNDNIEINATGEELKEAKQEPINNEERDKVLNKDEHKTISYKDVQHEEPTKRPVSAKDVYEANLAKYDAVTSLEDSKNKSSYCIIA